MGRWLDALKKRENAPDANPQNPQNVPNRGFEGFESFNSTVLQKNSEPNDSTKGKSERKDKTTNNHDAPFVFTCPEQESKHGQIIAFPGREWKPDTKVRSDDPACYMDALRLHGPMSYGMAMRVLQWGGTRAGQAEDALLKQGRIKFDKRGWAYPVDKAGE